MDFRFSHVVGFVGFFTILFYTFVDLITGKVTNYVLPASFSLSSFSIGNITAIINAIIGNSANYGIFYFLYAVLYGLLYPFAFIYQVFQVLITAIVWLISAMVYPFSFFPPIINGMLGAILAIIFIVSILSSITIASSEVD